MLTASFRLAQSSPAFFYVVVEAVGEKDRADLRHVAPQSRRFAVPEHGYKVLRKFPYARVFNLFAKQGKQCLVVYAVKKLLEIDKECETLVRAVAPVIAR
jgi:hypothetical protein